MIPFFIGNWKMNTLCREAKQFVDGFREVYSRSSDVEIGIAPSYLAIPTVSGLISQLPGVLLGAQNVHWLANGAHTGEVSPPMLVEHGVQFVILGHSERRQFYGDTNETVSLRARGALDHGLRSCVCVGETREQFESGLTEQIVESQLRESLRTVTAKDLSNLVVCYEPVWAIGTGLAATPEQVAKVHSLIRNVLQAMFAASAGTKIRILYGGSVSAANIASFMECPDVQGAIVGGASLDPEKFGLLVQNGTRRPT